MPTLLLRRFQDDDLRYAPPRGCACIDDDGHLLPTGGGSRTEIHCATCPRGPFRSMACLFADCSIARARARELDRDRQGKYRAVCQFPSCGQVVHFDSILCHDHQQQVFRCMAETGQDYEHALATLIEEDATLEEEE